MDVVEKPWDALDLVDDHGDIRRYRFDLDGEQRGIGEEVLIVRFFEEIDPAPGRESRFGPCALPHATDAEEEETPTGFAGDPGVLSFV
jgi:hypothetical protein